MPDGQAAEALRCPSARGEWHLLASALLRSQRALKELESQAAHAKQNGGGDKG